MCQGRASLSDRHSFALLETDLSSYIMKRSHDAVLRRLQTVPIGAVAISVNTKSELLYEAEVSPRRQQDTSRTQAVGKGQMKPDERLVQLTQREVELLLRSGLGGFSGHYWTQAYA